MSVILIERFSLIAEQYHQQPSFSDLGKVIMTVSTITTLENEVAE